MSDTLITVIGQMILTPLVLYLLYPKIVASNLKRTAKKVAPFYIVDNGATASFNLSMENDKPYIFEQYGNGEFIGNGYDWTAIAIAVIDEKFPALKKVIEFDPEGDTFCAFSYDKEALLKFAKAFKKIYDNDKLLIHYLSKATHIDALA